MFDRFRRWLHEVYMDNFYLSDWERIKRGNRYYWVKRDRYGHIIRVNDSETSRPG